MAIVFWCCLQQRVSLAFSMLFSTNLRSQRCRRSFRLFDERKASENKVKETKIKRDGVEKAEGKIHTDCERVRLRCTRVTEYWIFVEMICCPYSYDFQRKLSNSDIDTIISMGGRGLYFIWDVFSGCFAAHAHHMENHFIHMYSNRLCSMKLYLAVHYFTYSHTLTLTHTLPVCHVHKQTMIR